jgi:hypothetical protein
LHDHSIENMICDPQHKCQLARPEAYNFYLIVSAS